jgi:hypothetical protein
MLLFLEEFRAFCAQMDRHSAAADGQIAPKTGLSISPLFPGDAQ